MTDQGDELALAHQQVEAFDNGQWSFRRGIDFLDLVELDVTILDRACGGFAMRAWRAGIERDRYDIGQAATVFGRGSVVDPDIHEVLGDRRAQSLVGRVVVDGRAIARTRERHLEFRAERRTRSRIERDDAVCQQNGFVDVVGDENDGLFFLRPDRLDLGLQLGAGKRIKRRQRLVEQQHLRIHGKRAGDRNALAHAAGKLRRLAVRSVAQPNHVDVMRDALAPLGRRTVCGDGIDRERDVALHREPGQQRVTLKHDTALRTWLGNGCPTEEHFAGIRCDQTGHQADQCALAGPGKSDNRDEFAVLDRERNVVQDARA